jgi:hypothetical protein
MATAAHRRFQAAVEALDRPAMVAALHPDVVLHSPVTFKPFHGRQAVGQLFGILMQVFEEFSYTDQLVAPGSAALIFQARVGDREVQGLDLLRFDGEGLIEDFTVMVRPLSATIALGEAVREKLAV